MNLIEMAQAFVAGVRELNTDPNIEYSCGDLGVEYTSYRDGKAELIFHCSVIRTKKNDKALPKEALCPRDEIIEVQNRKGIRNGNGYWTQTLKGIFRVRKTSTAVELQDELEAVRRICGSPGSCIEKYKL
jgi:hypothetical protein